jgi:uncharacterized SAM-binding protein YcdF (DUF218 family)
MNRERGRLRTWVLALVLAGGLLVVLGARAGRFLVVDTPQPSDVIVVLAGEAYHRPERALQLLAQGFGQRIVLDVPSTAKIYEFTQIQLAENYVHDLPQAAAITICPIQGLSTRDEAKELKKCLPRGDEQRVLIVTSDFHTRRALSVFRRELPGHSYAVAASRDQTQFGLQWWTHRQWAKTFIDEWLRLIWWEGVDKWR